MPENSLEFNCEALIMDCLDLDARLDDYETRHHQEDTRAKINTLVVKATKGNRNLAGWGGFYVKVSVTFASSLAVAAADAVAAAITEAVFGQAELAFQDNRHELEAVCVEDDTDTERTDLKKTRKRVVTFTLIAALSS